MERLRQLQLQNQQMEQQLRMAQQSTAAPDNPTPESDLIALKAAYGCGVLNGMLKAMDAMGNTESVNGIREALKATECDQIVKYSGAEASIDSPPVEKHHQPDIDVNSDGLPAHWKSLTTGRLVIIRRDGDRMYLETVMPDEAKQAGCFTLANLQKIGDIHRR